MGPEVQAGVALDAEAGSGLAKLGSGRESTRSQAGRANFTPVSSWPLAGTTFQRRTSNLDVQGWPGAGLHNATGRGVDGTDSPSKPELCEPDSGCVSGRSPAVDFCRFACMGPSSGGVASYGERGPKLRRCPCVNPGARTPEKKVKSTVNPPMCLSPSGDWEAASRSGSWALPGEPTTERGGPKNSRGRGRVRRIFRSAHKMQELLRNHLGAAQRTTSHQQEPFSLSHALRLHLQRACGGIRRLGARRPPMADRAAA